MNPETNWFTFISDPEILNQLLSTGLAMLIGILGLLLIFLLIRFSRKRTTSAVSLEIEEALAAQRFNARVNSSELNELRKELRDTNLELLGKKLDLETVDSMKNGENGEDDEKGEIQQEISELENKVIIIENQLADKENDLRDESRTFAHNYIKEVIPSSLDISIPAQEKFFLEFTTVTVIIMAILILSILDILSGEQSAAILAAIAGYVLGRSTSSVAGSESKTR